MKAITNKIINNKEVIIIVSFLVLFVGLITYNIFVHGVRY